MLLNTLKKTMFMCRLFMGSLLAHFFWPSALSADAGLKELADCKRCRRKVLPVVEVADLQSLSIGNAKTVLRLERNKMQENCFFEIHFDPDRYAC